MVVSVERGASDLHMVQLVPLSHHHPLLTKIENSLTFLLPAFPGCPGKETVCALCQKTFFVLLVTLMLPGHHCCWKVAHSKTGTVVTCMRIVCFAIHVSYLCCVYYFRHGTSDGKE